MDHHKGLRVGMRVYHVEQINSPRAGSIDGLFDTTPIAIGTITALYTTGGGLPGAKVNWDGSGDRCHHVAELVSAEAAAR